MRFLLSFFKVFSRQAPQGEKYVIYPCWAPPSYVVTFKRRWPSLPIWCLVWWGRHDGSPLTHELLHVKPGYLYGCSLTGLIKVILSLCILVDQDYCIFNRNGAYPHEWCMEGSGWCTLYIQESVTESWHPMLVWTCWEGEMVGRQMGYLFPSGMTEASAWTACVAPIH